MEVKLARHGIWKMRVLHVEIMGFIQRTYSRPSSQNQHHWNISNRKVQFISHGLLSARRDRIVKLLAGSWLYQGVKAREIYYLIPSPLLSSPLLFSGWAGLDSYKLNIETKLASAKFSGNRKPTFSISVRSLARPSSIFLHRAQSHNPRAEIQNVIILLLYVAIVCHNPALP